MNNISWELIGKVHVAGMVLGILGFLAAVAIVLVVDLIQKRRRHEKK